MERASRPKMKPAAREAGSRNMLVLTRKSNQSIMIGIQAPRDIPVFRKEVYLEIQQENVAAGASARAEVDDALKRLSSKG
jgi:carbon storage regulator